jgi:DNA end-binding protein Ku
MSRSTIFRAIVRAGKLHVPVRFYSAALSRRVRFRLLHAEDQQPLQRRMVCPRHDKPIAADERARGYEIARGEFVVLDAETLDSLRPDSDRRIDVLRFVDADAIDRRLFDRPYWLGPDGDDGAAALLLRALSDQGRAAVCRWTMRRRVHHGVLQAVNEALLMTSLRYAHELVDESRFGIPRPDYSDKEFESACGLIDELAEPFEPDRYQDDYQQRLMRFIEQKARGEEPTMKTPKRRRPTTPGRLQAALQKSLERARAD